MERPTDFLRHAAWWLEASRIFRLDCRADGMIWPSN
jgi:hypothetical protein